MTIQPIEGDNTQQLQQAIDNLREMTPDSRGFRETFLLKRGQYPVEGALPISLTQHHSLQLIRRQFHGWAEAIARGIGQQAVEQLSTDRIFGVG